jgi:hypothetical protein
MISFSHVETRELIRRASTYIFILLPIATVLMLYGYIGSFNRLLGDSFCSFHFAERLGLFRSIWFWRIIWSGRYTAYGFDWAVMKILGSDYLFLLVPLVIVIWVFINAAALHLLLKQDSNAHKNIYLPAILGPAIVFLSLTISPSIQQSLLWLDGFRAYTLPLILITFFIIPFAMLKDSITSKTSLVVAAVVSLVLFFTSSGLSETFAIFQFALLGLLTFYYLAVERPARLDKNSVILISGLTGALIGILVIATAPGNIVRQSFFLPHPNLVDLLRISFGGYADFLKDIFTDPENFSAVAGCVALSFWAGGRYEGELTRHKEKILFQVFGAIVLSFVCFPPAVYSTFEPLPGRALIIPGFTLGVAFSSAAFFAGHLVRQKPLIDRRVKIPLLIISILLISFSAWMNSSALYTSRSIYIDFAKKWDEVDVLIKQAKNDGMESVTIPDTSNWANLDQPNDNPNHYMNECYSGFYGIQVFGPSR